MPVGTAGTVKAVGQKELANDIGAQVILGNTYHLVLRPGTEVLEAAGGLHPFMNWQGPILTDSGGYQVYSLAAQRKITDEGVTFRSHLDGSPHFFSPESVVQIQRIIGSEFMMVLDECAPYPCDEDYARRSLRLTHAWAKRCQDEFNRTSSKYDRRQELIPIVQGSVFRNLRKESAAAIAEMGFEANAIGGLSVGEPAELMYEMTAAVCEILPREKPRYLMGVGTPENLLECISLGIDMFDCVMPTRNARHGLIYTWEGIRNMKNAKYAMDFNPVDENSELALDRQHSRAYLHHLFRSNEILGMQIASVHNLHFYCHLMREARSRIESGNFMIWKNEISNQLNRRL